MFRRNIEVYFKQWQERKHPHPLIIRGARQIGKSSAVRKFAEENFHNLIELNFEKQPEFKKCFENLNPEEICEKIQAYTEQEITKTKTLIFLDEIQHCPSAILSLRYFYEDMPGQHVIAAGSLLDFTLNSGEISVPVGRIHYLYMKPMSFYEYLEATKQKALLKWIQNINLQEPFDELMDQRANKALKKYFHTGGMPEVIKSSTEEPEEISQMLTIQSSILASYRDDFGKYSNRAKHKYLEDVLSGVVKQTCEKFKYSKINPDAQSRDIKEALELLISAGIIHKIKCADATGLPFEAGASDKHFKTIFLDIGLMQNLLGINKEIILSDDLHSIASGALAEQFVGQELIAQEEVYNPAKLYYWAREDRSSSAEIDYLIAVDAKQYPVEVKSGRKGKLKSLRYFMDKFKSPLGIRISTNPLEYEDSILSIPLYATAELGRLVREVFA